MLQRFNGQIREGFCTRVPPDGIARRAPALNALLSQLICEIKWLAIGRSARQIHISDFRNDIAGAVNLHPIADTNILAATDALAFAVTSGDIIFVVQCGIGDHHTANGHRIETGHRA